MRNGELGQHLQRTVSAEMLLFVDVTLDKRVHLSELLSNIPEKNYVDVDEVAAALEGVL